MDKMILEDMELCGIKYKTADSYDNDKILSIVLGELE